MKWCLDHRVEVLPLFADSFSLDVRTLSPLKAMARTLRHKLRNAKLSRVLNNSRIRWVGNHNVPASQDLVRIGVAPKKVLPWDWPPIVSPAMFEPKEGVSNGEPWRLFFIGSVVETKGVGDAVEAVSELKRSGRKVELTVVGSGDIDRFSQLAVKCGIAENVHFQGKLGHDQVIELIRGSHAVLVPSHHRYTEGIPMVIYESFSTRTPVICSDHPMFVNKVSRDAADIVPERQPIALAKAVEQLLGDNERYHRMSQATQEAWDRLQCPLRYFDLIEHWLSGTPEDDAWLSQFSLATGRYTA
jgi:glycosyltransferase involved in cell wall biosynthesis